MEVMQTMDALKERIQKTPITVVTISDQACNVCLAITPELEVMSETYPKASFVMVDTASIPSVASEYLAFVYPTLIIFAEGKETMRYERVFSMIDVEAHLSRIYHMNYED